MIGEQALDDEVFALSRVIVGNLGQLVSESQTGLINSTLFDQVVGDVCELSKKLKGRLVVPKTVLMHLLAATSYFKDDAPVSGDRRKQMIDIAVRLNSLTGAILSDRIVETR